MNKTEKRLAEEQKKTKRAVGFVTDHPEIFGACTLCPKRASAGEIYKPCRNAEGYLVNCTASTVGMVLPQPAGANCHRLTTPLGKTTEV